MPPRVGLLGEELVRPRHDHLVGVGEPGRGREHRSGVAHRHPVAQERPHPGDRGSEVDRPEDQHPRPRGVRRHEHRHPLTTTLPVRAVVQRLAAPGREQPTRISHHRVVGPTRPERARHRQTRPLGMDHQPPPHPRDVVVLDHRRHRHRPTRLDIGRDPTQLREALLVDHLHEHIQNPATGQTHRERVLVTDPVPLQHRPTIPQHLLRQLIDRPLHTTPRHRPHRLTPRPHQHRRPRLPRRRLKRRHHRRQPHRTPTPPPRQQLIQNVTHARPPPWPPRTPPCCARR